MEGIKTRELDSVKTQILSSTHLRGNFDACVTLQQDYISQLRYTTPHHELNIAAVSQDADDGSVVEDWYYRYSEYKHLSEEDKDNLKGKRKSRGHQLNKKTGAHKEDNNGWPLKHAKNARNFSSL